MTKLRTSGLCSLAKIVCIVLVFCAATAINSTAQTFTTLFSFNGSNGANPYASLIQGLDGNVYGTTYAGGANDSCTGVVGCGTVFRVTAEGTLTTLHSFDGTDGSNPLGLVQGTDGNLYGTTYAGGANDSCTSDGVVGCGTVFKITPGGTLTTLHSFDGTDGSRPAWGLVQATNGNFYGTTYRGGASIYYGTAFKITPSGTLTTLHSFNGVDGGFPFGGLVQATNGNFYGVTVGGGTLGNCGGGCGTVFKITPAGTVTTLHSFNGTDGNSPFGTLVQATDGNFYGMTFEGGDLNCGAPYGCGTVFKITATGTLTILHSFEITDGEDPYAGLVQATDGNLYGTTGFGGANFGGTVFEITLAGTLTTLYNFCLQNGSCPDGGRPVAGLVHDTNGNLYGTTYAGGASSNCTGTGGCGTVFSLSVGLGPFVETRPTFGKVGAKVIILGTNLTGTTSVSFGGAAATFTVVSSSEIKTTVPAGAKTGTVTVTTPSSGTLKSNLIFKVIPQIKSFTPTSGPVGTQVVITGVSLMQATKVTVGGKAASFTVNFDTQVTATVPTGAKTGKIVIATPGGTAASATTFTVT